MDAPGSFPDRRNAVGRDSSKYVSEWCEKALRRGLSTNVRVCSNNRRIHFDCAEIVEPPIPPINAIQLSTSPSIFRPTLRRSGGESECASKTRYSKRAKLIGDRAEALVEKYLREDVPGATDVKWLAKIGETPGWDLQYRSKDGELIRVEVKGTIQQAVTSFELTANELLAAQTHGEFFRIVLVAECLSANPKIQVLGNPVTTGLTFDPIRWRVSFSSAGNPLDLRTNPLPASDVPQPAVGI
jgi:hypothetical protein